jgi:hypothetical protein
MEEHGQERQEETQDDQEHLDHNRTDLPRTLNRRVPPRYPHKPPQTGARRGSWWLQITEPQRQRLVDLYLAAADTAGLPDDPSFREALRSHVELGSNVAMQNSRARTDDELHPLREVPKWQWAGPESP